MVSELEKYEVVVEIYETARSFEGWFIRTAFITFFSCGYGGIPRSHVEIEFGKNSKAKHIHATNLSHIPTLFI